MSSTYSRDTTSTFLCAYDSMVFVYFTGVVGSIFSIPLVRRADSYFQLRTCVSFCHMTTNYAQHVLQVFRSSVWLVVWIHLYVFYFVLFELGLRNFFKPFIHLFISFFEHSIFHSYSAVLLSCPDNHFVDGV